MFQFLDGAIKSPGSEAGKKLNKCFNSLMVRLKAAVPKDPIARPISFNSLMVR